MTTMAINEQAAGLCSEEPATKGRNLLSRVLQAMMESRARSVERELRRYQADGWLELNPLLPRQEPDRR